MRTYVLLEAQALERSSVKKRRGKQKRRKTTHRNAASRLRTVERDVDRLEQQAQEIRRIRSARVAQLRGAMETYLDRSGLTLVPSNGSESVVFRRGREDVAYLFGDVIVAHSGQPRFSANFHEPGPHWRIAHDFLLALQDGHDPDVGGSSLYLVSRDSFSQEIPPDLAELGLTASARLRTQRHFAFHNPVKLTARDLLMTFEPTRYRAGGVEVPFRLEQSDETPVEAALRLTGSNDPLEVAFAPEADEAAALRAWPIALVGFADLTCLEIVAAMSSSRRGNGGTAQSTGAGARHRANRAVPFRRPGAGRNRFAWSSRLSPVGQTAQLAASFVAGHRRHLHPGQHCSEKARAAARSFGIQLGPGETWVQPHERGIPSEVVVELAWRAPSLLAEWHIEGSSAAAT